jgi:hypothetical protein
LVVFSLFTYCPLMQAQTKGVCTMAESPLDRYRKMRASMVPKAELCELVMATFADDAANLFHVNGGVFKWGGKTGEAEETGQFQILASGAAYQCNGPVDMIRDAVYRDGRLEVDAQTNRVIGNKWEMDANGKKVYDFHLSIGADGVIITGALNTGLLRWQGDGFVFLRDRVGGSPVAMQVGGTNN